MYKYIDQAANTITFANTIRVEDFVRFTATRAKTTQNGIPLVIVRTNTLLSKDIVVAKCDDACADSASIQRTVRVLTSGPSGNAVDLVADLEALVADLKTRPEYFSGFLPSAIEELELAPSAV